MKNFGKFATVILAMVIAPIISGFVVMKLWGWFIVPTFEMNPLRIVEAIGIMFLLNFVRAKRDKEASGDDFWSEFGANLVFLIAYSVLALLSGWIVQAFM